MRPTCASLFLSNPTWVCICFINLPKNNRWKMLYKVKGQWKGFPPLLSFGDSRHPVQDLALQASQPARSERQGRGKRVPGSVSPSLCPCGCPFPKALVPECPASFRGAFLQITMGQCLLCGYSETGSSGTTSHSCLQPNQHWAV